MSAPETPRQRRNWRWILQDSILHLHDRALAEHGGSPGIRDIGGIESALSRPVNLANYGDPDAADLAASYAFGIAKNHGFVDGNKRTAFASARIFLFRNGYELDYEETDALRVMENVADGRLAEAELAAWFRTRLRESQLPSP